MFTEDEVQEAITLEDEIISTQLCGIIWLKALILKKNDVLQLDDKETIKLVSLSVRDIINISFKSFLRDIASVVSTSLVNQELFGLYNNIEYAFNVMYFTENRQLQPTLASLLEEEMGISNKIRNFLAIKRKW
ncbi:hypothetical protein BD770DRAFT_410164 [Pilaira anomala]|nr:hypothetical protein BD770DRAFT_410164 [Pilaira anomala]